MRKLTLIAALLIFGSGAYAQPGPYGGWQDGGWQGDDDDTVTCAAIGCREGDFGRYPEYAPQPVDVEDPAPEADPIPAAPYKEIVHEPRGHDPAAEILKRLAEEPLPRLARTESEGVPADEDDDARQDFYRAIREHADGAGSLEDVEAAYGHLLPYRR